MSDLLPYLLRRLVLLPFCLSQRAVPIVFFKIIYSLLFCLIEISIEHPEFHSWNRWRTATIDVVVVEPIFVDNVNNDRGLLWECLEHMTIEESSSVLHFLVIKILILLHLLFKLQACLFLHLLFFFYLPLLIHGLLFRVHILSLAIFWQTTYKFDTLLNEFVT